MILLKHKVTETTSKIVCVCWRRFIATTVPSIPEVAVFVVGLSKDSANAASSLVMHFNRLVVKV